MAEEWKDTPAGDAILAERLDGERVRFNELRVGDIFRAVAPDGSYIDAGTHEPGEVWVRAARDPEQADGTECPQDYGWAIAIEYVESPKSFLN